MTQEHLSALLDGECSDHDLDGLLDAMEQDPTLKDDWSRMCRNREMADGTWIKAEVPSIVSAVMAALDTIPQDAARSTVVELFTPPKKKYTWKPLAGLAAAASVAAVALLAGLNFTSSDQTASASDVALSNQASTQQVALRQQPVDEDLDNYLIEHNNSLAEQGMGMNGTLRYASFAAHNAVYRADGRP